MVMTTEALGARPVDKAETVLVNMDGLKYISGICSTRIQMTISNPEPFDFHDRALCADPAMPVFYNDHVQIEEVRRHHTTISFCSGTDFL